MSGNKFDNIFNEFKNSENNIEYIGNVLGEGEFWQVRDMKYKGKSCAGKITKKKFHNSLAEKIKGPNIIKIYDILEKKYDGKDYSLIIMEKVLLNDLEVMIKDLHQDNYFNLINNPFLEHIGNNLVKYFVKQIVQGMEVLDKNELVHFGIKPDNILIQSGLVLKVTDFSFLINLQDYKDEQSIKIPEGAKGYVTPEYYFKTKIDKLTAKKQDYFSLGATIYLLKVGFQMIKYKKYEKNTMNEDRVIDLLQRDIGHIKSAPLMDSYFVDFLCQLINYIPEIRPSFEEIYRNKWLNKDSDEISFIIDSFVEGEERKLMKELIKSDYLIEKQAEIKKEKNRKNFTFID